MFLSIRVRKLSVLLLLVTTTLGEQQHPLCVSHRVCTACLLVRLGVNNQVKVWGFMRCWTGMCAQDWSLSTFLSILSFACLMLGLSVSENPEKDCWQLSY